MNKCIDQTPAFLEKFLILFQDLLAHEGYGDIKISISLLNNKQRQVRIKCGREYTFKITNSPKGLIDRYSIVNRHTEKAKYSRMERRLGKERRTASIQRRKNQEPRNFKLERRINGDRRTKHTRRRDD